jgi:two-component system OmpR family sensor kinase
LHDVRAGPSSLRTRLVLIFTAGSAAVLVGAAVFLFVVVDRALLTEVDEGLRARGKDLEVALIAADSPVADQDPFTQVIDADGHVVVSSTSTPDRAPILSADDLAKIAESKTIWYANVDIPELGGGARVWAKSVRVHDRSVTLVVGASLDQYVRTRERLLYTLLLGGPVLLAVSAVAGWLLAGAALRPVRRMASEADTIAITDLDRRLEVPRGHDEIAELGRTLNAMLDRVEQAIMHERRFIDDASHELRTPLTILRGELELALADTSDPEETERSLRSALEEAERLSRLANDLLVLARARAGAHTRPQDERVDVVAAVERIIELTAPTLGADVVLVGGSGTVVGDRDRLDQVLLNLIVNARNAAATTVRVEVTTGPAGGPAEGRSADQVVTILITDDGPGFAPAMLPVTFERFKRGDPARGRATGGVGLGLAITADIVRSWGGTIAAGNGAPGGAGPEEGTGSAVGGAWVRVDLPAAEAADPHASLID